MLARTPTITRSLKCSETGRLVTTSRSYPSLLSRTPPSPSRPTQNEAIGYSWELLTEVYQLPKDRLYVTYFEGDPNNGLEPDNEAKEYWLARGVSEDHILPGDAKDNFWGTRSRPVVFNHCILIFDLRNGCNWSLWALQVSADQIPSLMPSNTFFV